MNVYVGGDGKLHFVNSGGADSVLPFNNAPIIIEYDTIVDHGNGGSTTEIKYTATEDCYFAGFGFMNFDGDFNRSKCEVSGGTVIFTKPVNSYQTRSIVTLHHLTSGQTVTLTVWYDVSTGRGVKGIGYVVFK